MTEIEAAIRAKLASWGDDPCGYATCIVGGWAEMRDTLLAVLDLHKPRAAVEGPLEGKPICDGCSDGTNEWLATADPCPTKRAIAEKLGVEAGS